MPEWAVQYVTDCEGPLSLNDNALEMTAAFIPNGASFYAKISRFDDYLADIIHKQGYKAGDTLRLIVPFLKAYDVNNSMMEKFSRSHVTMVPGADKAIRQIYASMETFIISTSYAPYLRALCDKIGLSIEHAYCTDIDLDIYRLSQTDVDRIRSFKERIDELPEFKLPSDAVRAEDLPVETRKTVAVLNDIFFSKIPAMHAGVLLTAVDPIGGLEKAHALEDSLMRTGRKPSEVMYVGDSITDVQAFQTARDGGGLTVSFNGNRYAINAAEIALYGENAAILTMVAEAFKKGGKDAVYVLLRDLSQNILNEIGLRGYAIVTSENKEQTIAASEKMRKEIRGIAGDIG